MKLADVEPSNGHERQRDDDRENLQNQHFARKQRENKRLKYSQWPLELKILETTGVPWSHAQLFAAAFYK